MRLREIPLGERSLTHPHALQPVVTPARVALSCHSGFLDILDSHRRASISACTRGCIEAWAWC